MIDKKNEPEFQYNFDIALYCFTKYQSQDRKHKQITRNKHKTIASIWLFSEKCSVGVNDYKSLL